MAGADALRNFQIGLLKALDEPPRWLKELAHNNGVSHHLRILQEGVPAVF